VKKEEKKERKKERKNNGSFYGSKNTLVLSERFEKYHKLLHEIHGKPFLTNTI
jgi:hypothetical protein